MKYEKIREVSTGIFGVTVEIAKDDRMWMYPVGDKLYGKSIKSNKDLKLMINNLEYFNSIWKLVEDQEEYEVLDDKILCQF